MSGIKILTHYHPSPIFNLQRFSDRVDNAHSPGGLWLSDETEYGWTRFVQDQVRINPSGPWARDRETWKYQTLFEVDTEEILWLKTTHDLHQFTTNYGEPKHRYCYNDPEKPDKIGYGLHVNWSTVKTEHKGILISPYQDRLSNRHGDPQFHWYRFDCASACIWDASCLKIMPNPQ